jgi:transcriptional regulator with XRE-family HTH domain
MISNFKFRKILNDLKRRPEDAAKDLGVSIKKIQDILTNKKELDFKIIKKAIKIWPINYGDFFSFYDDTKLNFRIMRAKDTNISQRIMRRGGRPYYLYKDTIMSKLSPFKPELITELVIVKDNKPNNKLVKFNNGHFLHQFTYFIGPVNFYYIENNKKKVAKMNTGDSMYISPYVCHSFTTRDNKKNELGKILALTYTDKLDNETLNELTALGFDIANKFRINLKNEKNSFWNNLDNFMKNSSLGYEEFKRHTKLDLLKLKKNQHIPSNITLKKISNFLNINYKELFPPNNTVEVKIQKYQNNKKWYFPSIKKRNYLFNELTNIPQLSYSRGYEITILTNKKHKTIMEIPSHQYIYNLGTSKVNFIINNNDAGYLNPEDSMYIKPNTKHLFYGYGKLLVVRLGGRLSGDNLYQLSMISEKNLRKTIGDNRPWFNK